jgi:hypothetical protein
MFDLEREVDLWSRTVDATRCRLSTSGISAAELADHLHSEIERARRQHGPALTAEAAFAAAVQRFGEQTEVRAEHAKNRSWFSRVICRWAGVERAAAATRFGRGLLVAHALLWGALMISSTLVLIRFGAPKPAQWMLLILWVPSWWGCDQLLRRALVD